MNYHINHAATSEHLPKKTMAILLVIHFILRDVLTAIHFLLSMSVMKVGVM